MNLELYHDAILIHDLPEHGLRTGDVGTVVERHEARGKSGYTLEFFDMTGRTVAVATVEAEAVRPPQQDDLPTVRVGAQAAA